jgi:hypothetical protein
MGFDDNRIQFLHDADGKTTAVLVPIDLWQELTEDEVAFVVPEWHKDEVRKTIEETKPEDYIPLETFLEGWKKV